MAGLDTLYSNLGPATASLQGGVDAVKAEEAAQAEQAMNKARMDEILQRTSAAKDMAPLELQAKQTSNDVAKLKAASERADYRSELVGRMIPLVEKTPPAARLAVMRQYAEENGLPMDESHLQHFASIPADELPKYLITQRENDIKNSEKYRQALDVAQKSYDSHVKGAELAAGASRYATDQRANAAAAKTKGIASIQDNVRSGKMTAEKAAVALYGAAQFEADPVAKQQYEDMAKQYEQFAMNQRNAANQGKVDVGAAANLPTQTLPPALGGPGAGPVPTANPNRKPLGSY
jgi:hypothetical protein